LMYKQEEKPTPGRVETDERRMRMENSKPK
jgi:hypothetical protein